MNRIIGVALKNTCLSLFSIWASFVLIGCAADGGCGGCDGGGEGGERKGAVAGPERRQREDHMVPSLRGQVVGFCVWHWFRVMEHYPSYTKFTNLLDIQNLFKLNSNILMIAILSHIFQTSDVEDQMRRGFSIYVICSRYACV